SYTDIVNNFYPPFEAGIDSGAESIIVNHNIYENIDKDNPASLSSIVHNVLRNDLKFTGVIITDNLDMDAVENINDVTLKAVLAGNDLIITTDYAGSFTAIKTAIDDKTLSENTINKMAFKVLAWKYYKGLMYENQK
ncbi:MAG: beta-hexosaminidase, partial [Bacilli bacterium]|nr:beta-hexosaminidase [Bacilli bacterium]